MTTLALSVIIPTLNAATTLPATLAALREADRRRLRAVLVVDGGSADATVAVAAAAGASVIAAPRGRGTQLAAGARAATGDWLLFLHADTVLEPGWAAAVAGFVAAPGQTHRAGYFRFRLDDTAPAARRLEALVAWRCRLLGLPYGDQGLLIATEFYAELGGFRPLPLMEDVDLVRRIGRRRLRPLPGEAVTAATRYRRDGYVGRSVRNLACLALYLLGASPRLVRKLYG